MFDFLIMPLRVYGNSLPARLIYFERAGGRSFQLSNGFGLGLGDGFGVELGIGVSAAEVSGNGAMKLKISDHADFFEVGGV